MNKDEIVDNYDWRIDDAGVLPKHYFSKERQVGMDEEGEIIAVAGVSHAGEKLEGIKIVFTIPDVAAMMLSIAYKSWNEGIGTLNNIKPYKFGGPQNPVLYVPIEYTSEFYDCIEKIIQSYVFSYSAIEHFANTVIPDHYVYSKKAKDTVETKQLNKDNIERHVSLDEKLSHVLADVLKVETIRSSGVWSKFIKLKKTRDSIVHFKSKEMDVKSWPEGESIWNDLVFVVEKPNPAIIAKEIIGYYIKHLNDIPRWFNKIPF